MLWLQNLRCFSYLFPRHIVSTDIAILIYSLIFIHNGPGFDSVSNKTEYQLYFVESEVGRSVRLTTLPPSYAVVLKSRNRNFLEPSGQQKASNGEVLPSYNIIFKGFCVLAPLYLLWTLLVLHLSNCKKVFVLCLSILYKFSPRQLCSWHKFSLQ